MSINFIGKVSVYIPPRVLKNTKEQEAGYIMINNWEIHISADFKKTTVCIPKDTPFFLKKDHCPRFTNDGEPAYYAGVFRESIDNNDSSDFIIDMKDNHYASSYTFIPITNYDLLSHQHSGDYFIFNNCEHDRTAEYYIEELADEDDDDNWIEGDDISPLEMFDVQNIKEYSVPQLKEYMEIAARENKYDLAAIIRDEIEQNR